MQKIMTILLFSFFISCSKNNGEPELSLPAAGEFLVSIQDMQGGPYTCGYVRTIFEESTIPENDPQGNDEFSAIRAIDADGKCRFIFAESTMCRVKNYRILDYLFQEIEHTVLDTLISPGKVIEVNNNLTHHANIDVYWQRLDFSNEYDLSGKRVLTIVGNNYDFIECLMITNYMAYYGADVVIASNRLDVVSHYWLRPGGRYQSVPGPDSVTVLLQNLNLNDFDCLFCPGGEGPANLLHEYPAITNRIYQTWRSDTLLFSAICHGPLLLAASYIIDGKRITGHPDMQESVEEAGGVYVPGVAVLVDGNIQTGNWPYFNSFATSLAGILDQR